MSDHVQANRVGAFLGREVGGVPLVLILGAAFAVLAGIGMAMAMQGG